MRGLALNLLLALVWALFAGEVSLRELAVGFLLGFLILTIFPQALGTQSYVRRNFAALRFLGFFIREITVANVQVALLALRPHPPLHARIVAYPTRLRSDNAQTLLTAIVTLMPGSVVMGFNAERTVMYFHIIGFSTPQEARRSIQKVEDMLMPLLGEPEAHAAKEAAL